MDDGPRLEACLFERPLLLGQAVLVAASRVPRSSTTVGRRLLGGAKACVHLWHKLAVDLAAVCVVFG